MDIKKAFFTTALHLIEVLSAFGIAYLAIRLFNLPFDDTILGFVLAALAKFQRAMTSDWVNGQ